MLQTDLKTVALLCDIFSTGQAELALTGSFQHSITVLVKNSACTRKNNQQSVRHGILSDWFSTTKKAQRERERENA